MTLKVDGTNGVLQAYDYQVLTTGFSYTFASGTQTLFMNPAGTLATGTVTMPASPADGMTITFSSTQEITALTVAANSGQSISGGGAVTLAQNASLSYTYRLANTTWYPQQNASFPIGVGQSYQSYTTAQRVSGTTYYNTTGKALFVTMTTPNTTLATNYVIAVGGVSVSLTGNATAANYLVVSAIVPIGASYVYTYVGTPQFIRELR